jgi:hypothetical protein
MDSMRTCKGKGRKVTWDSGNIYILDIKTGKESRN